MKFAGRVQNLPPYVFAGMAKKIADLRARGIEVINFGMGDPDVPTPDYLVDALCDATRTPQNGRYPDYFGKPALRRAITDWYGARFDVHLEPDTEVLPLIGSKEGIANVALAFTDPGEGALVPDPAYPVYKYGTLMASGVPLPMPLREENGWLPDLNELEDLLHGTVNVMWLNYPNNPTGATISLDALRRAAELARRHGFLLASDEAYSELWFEGDPPASALQVGDLTNVVVLNTLSKRSSMPGYRSGFVAGDPDAIAALKRYRPNVGVAPQEVVQRAATVAWGDEGHVAEVRERYRRKRDVLLPALLAAGFESAGGPASFFLWMRTPGGEDDEACALRLLEHGIVCAPGSFFGAGGAGHVRVALVPPVEACERAAAILEGLGSRAA
jgi:succinyldiaminopimelate transaminase